MTIPVRQYSDIDMVFSPSILTGDVKPISNNDAIKQSLKNLVLLGFYDRPYRPYLGSGVNHMLFQPNIPITKHKIKSEIERVITEYETRVELISVTVDTESSDESYRITIEYYIENELEPLKVDFFLERVR